MRPPALLARFPLEEHRRPRGAFAPVKPSTNLNTLLVLARSGEKEMVASSKNTTRNVYCSVVPLESRKERRRRKRNSDTSRVMCSQKTSSKNSETRKRTSEEEAARQRQTRRKTKKKTGKLEKTRAAKIFAYITLLQRQ